MENHNWIRNPFLDNANASQGFKARFHYDRGKEHSLFVLLIFFALASILTARFNRRSIKQTKNALFHGRSGNGPLHLWKLNNLIDLSFDLTLKSLHNLNLLISFWVKARSEFPLVGCKALRVLVPFATSYLCKAGFSAVAVIKRKYRNKIDIERNMCVAISNIAPRVNKMCIEQQAHY